MLHPMSGTPRVSSDVCFPLGKTNTIQSPDGWFQFLEPRGYLQHGSLSSFELCPFQKGPVCQEHHAPLKLSNVKCGYEAHYPTIFHLALHISLFDLFPGKKLDASLFPLTLYQVLIIVGHFERLASLPDSQYAFHFHCRWGSFPF